MLSKSEAMQIMHEFNQRCVPPWNDADLERKVDESIRLDNHQKSRGYLLGASGKPRAVHSAPLPKPPEVAKSQAITLDAAIALPVAMVDGARQFLRAAFQPGELVCICPAVLNDEGREIPDGKGTVMPLEWWLKKLEACGGDINRVFWSADKTGIYVRVNPVRDDSGKDSSVAVFRHLLLESDKISLSEQYSFFKQIGLQITSLVYSGGKSIHALVRIDAKDKGEYDQRVQAIYTRFENYKLDPANKNPSRFSRLPGCERFDKRQELLELSVGASNYADWLASIPMDEQPAVLNPIVEDAAKEKCVILPSGEVSISESAINIFGLIAPKQKMFFRGGAAAELTDQDGVSTLQVIKPDAFRTRVEKYASLFAWRTDGTGQPVLKPSRLSCDDARAILASAEARDLLPPVSNVLRCPVLTESPDGEPVILSKGYHATLGGLLIVAGKEPPIVPLIEAVKTLLWLLEETHFQSAGDRSRAMAAFITPALRLGGFLPFNIPIDVAEADQSQAGKGYRHKVTCAIYNESSSFVTARQGGVGSMDESFSSALVSGRPFVCLDNFRGKVDSQNLEAFITAPGMFPARIPYHGQLLIDPKRFILQMSSNGMEATRDLANRSSISRILKRQNFNYRDVYGDVKAYQERYLGSVFSLMAQWIRDGKPRSSDCRHDFREWNQILDYFVQQYLGCAPLMDGHESAQERVSNPALSWIRSVALAVQQDKRLGELFTASGIVELCEQHNLDIPGKPTDEDKANRAVGITMKRIFTEGSRIVMESLEIARTFKEYRKPSGDLDTRPAYVFTATPPNHPTPPNPV